MVTEQQLVKAILLALGGRRDCRVWRQNTGAAMSANGRRVVRFGVPGAADITGLLADGRRLEVEVKRPGGRQRPEQHAFQQMVERFGGVYILARTVEEAVVGVEDALKGGER